MAIDILFANLREWFAAIDGGSPLSIYERYELNLLDSSNLAAVISKQGILISV